MKCQRCCWILNRNTFMCRERLQRRQRYRAVAAALHAQTRGTYTAATRPHIIYTSTLETWPQLQSSARPVSWHEHDKQLKSARCVYSTSKLYSACITWKLEQDDLNSEPSACRSLSFKYFSLRLFFCRCLRFVVSVMQGARDSNQKQVGYIAFRIPIR